MVEQRQKDRFSSLRRLLCSLNKDREEKEEGYDDESRVPSTKGFRETIAGVYTQKTPSRTVRRGGIVDLDVSVVSDEDSISNKSSNGSVPHYVRPETKYGSRDLRLPAKPTSQLTPTSKRTTKKNVPRHWHGDGGEDQPVVKLQTRKFRNNTQNHKDQGVPLVVTTSFDEELEPGRMSPESLGFSLGLDLESLGGVSLVKRVEIVKSRAERLLVETQQQKEVQGEKQKNSFRRSNGAASVKSLGSCVLTDPTCEGTASVSASSNSFESLSGKIKRLQQVKEHLQRFSDEDSETSSIGFESARGLHLQKTRGPCFQEQKHSSMLDISQDSSNSGSTPPGSKITDEGGDVLHILSLLEAINGYDLSIDEHNYGVE